MHSFPLREQAQYSWIHFLLFDHFKTTSSVHSRKRRKEILLPGPGVQGWSPQVRQRPGGWGQHYIYTGRSPTTQGPPQWVQSNSNGFYSLIAVSDTCQCLQRALNALCHGTVSTALWTALYYYKGSERLTCSRSRGWMRTLVTLKSCLFTPFQPLTCFQHQEGRTQWMEGKVLVSQLIRRAREVSQEQYHPGSSWGKAQCSCRLGEIFSFWSSLFFTSSSPLALVHSPTLSLHPLGLLGQQKLILLISTFWCQAALCLVAH